MWLCNGILLKVCASYYKMRNTLSNWSQFPSSLQRTMISSFCYVWFQGRSIQNTVMELRNICNHPYLSQLHAEEVRLNEFNLMSFGKDVLFLNVLKVLKLDYFGICRQRMFYHLIICRLWCVFVGNLKCLTEYSQSWRLQIIGWETLCLFHLESWGLGTWPGLPQPGRPLKDLGLKQNKKSKTERLIKSKKMFDNFEY